MFSKIILLTALISPTLLANEARCTRDCVQEYNENLVKIRVYVLQGLNEYNEEVAKIMAEMTFNKCIRACQEEN